MHIKYTYIRTNTHTHKHAGRVAAVDSQELTAQHIYLCMHIKYKYMHTNKHTHTHQHADRRAAVDGTRNSCKTSGRSAGTQPKIGRERPLQLDAYMWTHKCTFTRTLM